MSFELVRTRANFSPARNVRSTTAALSSDFSLVRTNAPPLPGFTCWKSTMRQVCPSSSMCIPVRNWFVETTSATAGECSPATRPHGSPHGHELLRERRQELDAVLAHDRQVLDPHAPDAGQVDPRLDRDHVADLER